MATQSTLPRSASLKLSNGPQGQVLTATVPPDISSNELEKVALNTFGLISQLHHCTCLSGRVSVLIQEGFGEVINVDLSQP